MIILPPSKGIISKHLQLPEILFGANPTYFSNAKRWIPESISGANGTSISSWSPLIWNGSSWAISNSNVFNYIGDTPPLLEKKTSGMNNRPSIKFNGSGGYLEINTDIAPRVANSPTSYRAQPFFHSICISINEYPSLEKELIKIMDIDDNIYYTVCINSSSIYIKSNTGNYTMFNNYNLNTSYSIQWYRLAYNISNVFVKYNTAATVLYFTPTNFPNSFNFYYKFRIINSTSFNIGDFIYTKGSLSISASALPGPVRTYLSQKYSAVL